MEHPKGIVSKYPPEVLNEINDLIDRNNSGAFILRAIQSKYPELDPPLNHTTLNRYIKKYKHQNQVSKKIIVEAQLLAKFSEGINEIEHLVAQVTKQDNPDFNKIRLMEGLVGKCLIRINALEAASKDKASEASPGIDGAIVKYISEVRNIIESVLKMSALFRSDEQETVRLVRLESKMILELVRSVALEVCPEKYNAFSQILKQKLQAHKISLDSQQAPNKDSIVEGQTTNETEPTTAGQPTPADTLH
jgi:hypothetical protein